MKLIGTIKSIINENKDNSITNMIKTLGISDAIKYFGNYYTIEPYLKEVDKVNFIKDKVNELGEDYIDLYWIDEEPIIYEEEDGEIHQIESLGNVSVDIRVYQDMGDILYEYSVKYESLPSHIIELLVEILLNH